MNVAETLLQRVVDGARPIPTPAKAGYGVQGAIHHDATITAAARDCVMIDKSTLDAVMRYLDEVRRREAQRCSTCGMQPEAHGPGGHRYRRAT